MSTAAHDKMRSAGNRARRRSIEMKFLETATSLVLVLATQALAIGVVFVA